MNKAHASKLDGRLVRFVPFIDRCGRVRERVPVLEPAELNVEEDVSRAAHEGVPFDGALGVAIECSKGGVEVDGRLLESGGAK